MILPQCNVLHFIISKPSSKWLPRIVSLLAKDEKINLPNVWYSFSEMNKSRINLKSFKFRLTIEMMNEFHFACIRFTIGFGERTKVKSCWIYFNHSQVGVVNQLERAYKFNKWAEKWIFTIFYLSFICSVSHIIYTLHTWQYDRLESHKKYTI